MRRLLCVVLFVLGGCNAPRETYQLQQAPTTDPAGIAVDAKQRFVWFPKVRTRVPHEERGEAVVYQIADRQAICAEPSPDAVSAFAASLSTQLGVALQRVEVNAALARSLVETVQQLTERTEMMQLLRDGYYRACEAYANGMMGEFGYALLLNQLDDLIVQALALNTIAQQRPLPESAADRQALANEPAQRELLTNAQKRLEAERVALAGAEQRMLQSAVERDAAEAARARAERLRDQVKPAGEKADAREEDRRALREAEAELAEQNKRRDLAATRATEAATTRTAANQRVETLVADVKKLETDLASATRAAGAVAQPPFAKEGFAAIQAIVEGQPGGPARTIAGACLMWFSQHMNVLATPSPNEAAIAAACRGALGYDPGAARFDIAKALRESSSRAPDTRPQPTGAPTPLR